MTQNDRNAPVSGAGLKDIESAPKDTPPRTRWRLWGRVLLGVLLLAGFSAVAILGGFLAFTTQIATREPRQIKPMDGIVVLTGGDSRVSDAVTLLSKGYGRRLLITGVNPTTSPGELRRALPDGEELISCCIDLGHKALNTRGNAIEAAEWTRAMKFRSLVVVTSTWHMPRALVELNRSLPDVELSAYPVVTSRMEAENWWRDPVLVQLLFKEYLQYVMAQLKIRPAQAVVHVPVAETTPEPPDNVLATGTEPAGSSQ